MNKNIFLYDNYLKILEDYVLGQKEKGIKYNYQKLSEDLGIQKSYLSKVLANQANLNSDQFYLFTKLLKIKAQELQYAELLLAKERCGNSERKKELTQKISNLKKENTKTEAVLNIKSLKESNLSQYYLNPWAQIIHMAFTIKKFQETPLKLKTFLSIKEAPFRKALDLLEELELIQWQGEKVSVTQESIHLSKGSPYFWPWRSNIVQLGQMKSQSHAEKDCYNFSVFFSSKPEVKEEIHSLFLEYLKKVETLVKRSESKNLYQMNFDLIPWL